MASRSDNVHDLPLSSLAVAVGLLQSLTAARLDGALAMLHDYSKPGIRYDAGKLVYSAEYLSDEVIEGQEVLPL